MHRTKLLLAGILLILFGSLTESLYAQTAPVVQVCQLSDFTQGPMGHAVYLHYLPGAITPRYRWDSLGGTLTIYADSTARITGRVFNDSLPNWQWDVDFWFINQLDYASWTALGRDVKIEYAPAAAVNANKQDWLFWEVDSTRSRLYGVPGTFYDGDTVLIRHNPPNREFGLQFGLAANSKNGNFGLSVWFLFDGPGYSGHGDINVNASCGPAPCDVDASATAVCQTDSTFASMITFTGSGGPFILSDNQGTAPLVVNTGGTYLYGSYASGDTVEIYVSDSLAVGCVDTVGGLTADCTPVPVCDVVIDSAQAACVTDSTFDITVSFSGTGTYTLSDDNGVLGSGLTAGTYTYGSYPSNTVVTLILTDESIANCADTLSGITATCAPVPVCDVMIDSAQAACVTDSTFDITVSFSGSGTYTLSDDNGVLGSGLTASTYTYGSYPSNTVVTLILTDETIANCADTLSGITATCAPVPVCDVMIDSAQAVCVTDSTFDITVTFSGTGTYTLADDLGVLATGLVAGTYTYGSYPSNTVVTLILTDESIANCADTLGGITTSCSPTPVCEVAIDSAQAVCLTDTTFEIQISFTGTGPYNVFDNKGSAPLAGVSGGTYSFGTYQSGDTVTVYLEDPSFAACLDSIAGLTQTCVPTPPVCGVGIDSVYADCASDTSFTIFVKISGVGNNFQISDDQGSTPAGGLSAGWYSFGDYFNSTEVLITVTDLTLPGCDTTVGPLTADCTPVAVCDLVVDTVYATCISDTTFEVTVSILGSSQFYQVFDNQGSMSLFPVGAGSYTFGPYMNGTQVMITASDLAIFNCFAMAGPVTESCGAGLQPTPSAEIWATGDLDQIVVGWEAGRASLISGFFLERTLDPELETEWSTIAWVPVNLPIPSPAVFEYVDYQVSPGFDYTYRVKIVQNAGQSLYSDEASARLTSHGGIWIGDFYPNPNPGDEISFGMSSSKIAEVNWVLYNMTGSLLDQGLIKALPGKNDYKIDFKGIMPGIYFLQVWYEGVLIRTKKIVVVN